MKTRNIVLIPILLALAFLVGCSPETSGGGGDWDGSISDSALSGSFGGKSFSTLSGYAEVDSFEPMNYRVKIYNIAANDGFDPWDFGAYPFGGYLEVFFSIPQTTGTYDLYWDLESGDHQTATLYDPDDGSMNYICAEGRIRIDSVSGGFVTGAIAAYSDSSNYVNGTFSVPIEPAS